MSTITWEVGHEHDDLVWETLNVSEGQDKCWFLTHRDVRTSVTGEKDVAYIRGTKSWAFLDVKCTETDLPPGMTLDEAKAYVLTLYRMR